MTVLIIGELSSMIISKKNLMVLYDYILNNLFYVYWLILNLYIVYIYYSVFNWFWFITHVLKVSISFKNK